MTDSTEAESLYLNLRGKPMLLSDEVKHHTSLCALEDFIDLLLSPSLDGAEVASILKLLSLSGKYSTERERWEAGLPEAKGESEQSYAAPFVDISNSILKAVVDVKGASSLALPSTWQQGHAGRTFQDDLDRLATPDLVNVTVNQPDSDHGRRKGPFKEEETVDEGVERPGKRRRLDDSSNSQGGTSLDTARLERIIWRRTLVVGVVHSDSEGVGIWQGVVRLATGLRHILWNQQDRRFAFGLLFFHRSLSLWYCDRSGVLGADKLLDIDKHPDMFVRVMATLATMSPQQLGFDPTMKMVVPNYPPSFSYSLPLDKIPTQRKWLHWRIEIAGATYQTVELVSVDRTEVMCGGGIHVWRAYRLDERGSFSENDKMVLIKQHWRPFSDRNWRNELDVYHLLGDFDGQKPVPCAGEDVHQANTLRDFRKSITTTSLTGYLDIDKRSLPESSAQFLLRLTYANDKNRPEQTRDLLERVLSRLVIPINGILLEKATGLRELVSVLLDVVKDYEWMYYSKGVCHGGITVGSIFIDHETRRGHLADYHHARDHGPNYKPRKVSSLQEELRDHLAEFRKYGPQSEVSDNLALLLLHLTRSKRTGRSNASTAKSRLWDYLDASGTSPNGPLEISDMLPGLENDPVLPPDFSERTAIHAVVTGTVAFMSHKLLRDDDETHSAIHDMESLFWVVVFLCLTCEGLNGRRRPEPEHEVRGDELYEAFLGRYYLFEAPKEEIWKIKRNMFSMTIRDKKLRVLEDHVFPWFHPSFKPLNDLLSEWWTILCSGFDRYGNILCRHYPVTAFRHALEKALEKLPAEPGPNDVLVQQQLDIASVRRDAIALAQSV
ncbi:other/FunK1 protein kinase [Coprinopsis cinerea AmutBmut pab1-1]|nr:other/FunK1 protein kinase [Coprinopsis cinerea AmutBmut pab1-1]